MKTIISFLIIVLASCTQPKYAWYVQPAKVEHLRTTHDGKHTDFFMRPAGKAVPLNKDSIKEDGIITTMIRKRIPR